VVDAVGRALASAAADRKGRFFRSRKDRGLWVS
jgi:hypothetical protein